MVRLVVVLLFVCGVVVGCGAAEPEGPFPPRPAEIDVANVDPCDVLTGSQQAQLKVNGGRPTAAEPDLNFGRGCLWSNFDQGYGLGVRIVERSAGEIATAPGVFVQTVNGFGAVRSTELVDSAPVCALYIDASERQSIRVQAQSLRYGSDARPRPIDDVCRSAERTSEMVIRTLTG